MKDVVPESRLPDSGLSKVMPESVAGASASGADSGAPSSGAASAITSGVSKNQTSLTTGPLKA